MRLMALKMDSSARVTGKEGTDKVPELFLVLYVPDQAGGGARALEGRSPLPVPGPVRLPYQEQWEGGWLHRGQQLRGGHPPLPLLPGVQYQDPHRSPLQGQGKIAVPSWPHHFLNTMDTVRLARVQHQQGPGQVG